MNTSRFVATGTFLEGVIICIAWFVTDLKEELVRSYRAIDLEKCLLANVLRFFFLPEIAVRHICFIVHCLMVLFSAFVAFMFIYLVFDRICDGLFTGIKYW